MNADWSINPQKKKLSASQLNTFLSCPRKYKFSYIDKIKSPPSAVMLQSSAWHLCVEKNYNQKIKSKKDLSLKEMLAFYKIKFEELFKAELVVKFDEGETKESCLEEGLKIVEVHHKLIAPFVKPLAAEEKFLVELDEELDVIGVFDVRGKGWIADNKSKGRMPSEGDFAKDLQFSLYAWAYWKMYKVIPKLQMHLILRTKEIRAVQLETVRTEKQLLWLEEQMKEVGRAIKTGKFYPNMSGYLCSPKWCDHWKYCMEGKAIPKMEEKI